HGSRNLRNPVARPEPQRLADAHTDAASAEPGAEALEGRTASLAPRRRDADAEAELTVALANAVRHAGWRFLRKGVLARGRAGPQASEEGQPEEAEQEE